VKVDGKVFRKSLETTVFTTARLKLPDFVKKQRDTKRVEGAPATFGDAQKLYEQDLDSEHSVSEASKRYRRYCLKKLNGSWPELAGTKLARISESDCKEWAGRFSKTVDEQYFNNVLGTFRLILRRGGVSGPQDPTADIKRLGVRPTELKLPEPQQFIKMLEAIENSGAGQAQECADLVRFLAFSGCRISEARQVTWADVSDKTIKVHSAKVRKTGNQVATRLVPIIPEMRELLERLKQNPHSPTDRVCAIGECEKSLARASKLVGLTNKITHHDLRHLFATRCIESGIDVPTVAHWLGHRDGGALAMRVYGHLREHHSISMAEKVTFTNVPNGGSQAGTKIARN
jgi:integrase